MKKIAYRSLLALYTTYWIVTFLFVMPNNPINLSSYHANELFQVSLFQRWAFFAPPPSYNQRVYAIFKDKRSDRKDVFEILHPILLAKSKSAPFNSKQQILDYIFSSSLINTEGNIRMLHDIFKNQNAKTSLVIPDSVVTQKLVMEIERTSDFKTIAKYSRIIAVNNNIDPNKVYYQIKVINVLMPQFIDRYSKEAKEEIMFSSHFLSYEKD